MSLSEAELDAIARVTIKARTEAEGSTEGTAFLVAPQYAITALHVLQKLGDITLVFEDGEAIEAACIQPIDHSKPDWALLKLRREVAREPLRLRPWWTDESWQTVGYGRLWIGDAGRLDRGPLDGMLVVDGQQLDVRAEQLVGHTSDKAQGFSGAPIVVSGYVVGVISYAREDEQTKLIKGGQLSAVSVETILAEWPQGHARPQHHLPCLIAALEAAIAGVNTPRDKIVAKLGLTGRINDRRIAEKLVSLSYKGACEALAGTQLALNRRVWRLVEAMWIGREAGMLLYNVLSSPRPIAAIRAAAITTIKHHLILAQGNDNDSDAIIWDDLPHLIELDSSSGEGLEVLIERGATAAYGCEPEDIPDKMNDAMNRPAIFATPDTPADADIDLVAEKFKQVPRLIIYRPAMSKEHLAERPLQATLIEPFPDTKIDRDHAKRESKEKP